MAPAVEFPLTRAVGMGPLPELLERWEGARAVERSFSAAGLPLGLVEERDHLIPLEAMVALFENAARAAGTDLFGLHVGLEMSPADYGLWVRYALQGETLLDAIERIIRNLRFYQSGGAMSLQLRDRGCVAMQYRNVAMRASSARQHSDHVIPVLLRVVRSYLGPAWLPERFEVHYPKPAGPPATEDLTKVEWRYECAGVALVMPAAALRTRRSGPAGGIAPGDRIITDVEVGADLRRQSARSVCGTISALVALRLLDGQTDMDGVARVMGIGRRSLQRELAQEGSTYRELLEVTRMRRARALICEAKISVTDAAFDLGYSDPAHFSRAFKRHYGVSPSQWRDVA